MQWFFFLLLWLICELRYQISRCILTILVYCNPIIVLWSQRSNIASTMAFCKMADLITSAVGTAAWLLLSVIQLHGQDRRIIGIEVVIKYCGTCTNWDIYHSEVSSRQRYEPSGNLYKLISYIFFSCFCCLLSYLIWTINCTTLGLPWNVNRICYSCWLELMFSSVSAYKEGDICCPVSINYCYNLADNFTVDTLLFCGMYF